MPGINLCKFVFIRILIYIYVYKFFDITSMKIQRINLILYCLVTLLPFTSCSLDEKSHDMMTTVDSHGVSLNSALSELNTTLGILYTETKTLAAKSTSNISEIITVTYDDIMGPETKSDENSDFGNLLYVIKYNRRVYRFLQYLVHPPVYLDVFCSFWDIFATRVPEEPTKTVHSGGKSKPGACGQALHQPWSGEFDDGDAGAAALDVLVGE